MSEFKKVKLKGISDYVEVNEDGSIIKFKEKIVKQHRIKGSKNSYGYNAVSIQGKSFYVHRIVAEAYIPNKKPITNKYVLHISEDLSNNHYTNLKWGTSKELYEKTSMLRKDKGGEYRGSSTISYEEALKIAKRLDNGEYAKDICLEYNVSEMSIARIRKRYCKEKTVSPRYDKDIKDIVLKLSLKHSVPEISKITGLTYHTVYRWIKNSNTSAKKEVAVY
jgi:hypothetical protein